MRPNPLSLLFCSALFLGLSAHTASAASLNVVTSIKPVHSLVAGVMNGVATPLLLIDNNASPHNYALKPSQARDLQNADLVIWIGHELETSLEKPISNIAANAQSLSLLDVEGLTLLTFEEHEDEHHDDEAHEGEHEHEEAHEEEHADEHGHADEHDHDHDGFDPHIWLDPQNAKILVRAIQNSLENLDPEHTAQYAANAEQMQQKLDALLDGTTTKLAGIHDKKFLVFHDGYGYFENRFGIHAAGSITLNPEVMPGADHISEIRQTVMNQNITCLFSEPQFEPRIIPTLIEGTATKSAVLDPLGANLENGPKLYFQLINNLADALVGCLKD